MVTIAPRACGAMKPVALVARCFTVIRALLPCRQRRQRAAEYRRSDVAEQCSETRLVDHGQRRFHEAAHAARRHPGVPGGLAALRHRLEGAALSAADADR